MFLLLLLFFILGLLIHCYLYHLPNTIHFNQQSSRDKKDHPFKEEIYKKKNKLNSKEQQKMSFELSEYCKLL